LGVKINDIARIVGVSPATVSLALNGKPGVAEATRRRVLQATKALEERSDLRRQLGSLKAGAICFVKIVRHGRTLNREHDVFIAAHLEGLDEEARSLGYTVEVKAVDATLRSGVDPALSLLGETDAAGFVVLGTELEEEEIVDLARLDRPIVFMDTHFGSAQACFANMDNCGSVFEALEHFKSAGHRDLGYVRSDTRVRNFRLRDLAVREASEKLGLRLAEHHVFTVDSTYDGAYGDMQCHLRTRSKLPTALFIVNDVTAYGCIKAIKEAGMRIPEDVSVIGFDDLPTSAMLDPPLTSIRVMNREIGQAAMRLLMRRIAGGPRTPIEKVEIGGQLVPRGSVRKLSGA